MASKQVIANAKKILAIAVTQGTSVTRAVRYVALHYKTLTRAELLQVADMVHINRNTASTQFYKARHHR